MPWIPPLPALKPVYGLIWRRRTCAAASTATQRTSCGRPDCWPTAPVPYGSATALSGLLARSDALTGSEDVQEGNQRPRTEHLVTLYHARHVRKRYPCDVASLLGVAGGRCVTRPFPQVDVMWRVDHADHGLEGDQLLERRIGAPSCLFFDFPSGRCAGIFPRVDVAARKLPAPPVGHESVPPEHEHTVSVIDHSSD